MDRQHRQRLERILASARETLFLQALLMAFIRVSVVVMPVAAVGVAISQRWFAGQGSLSIFLLTLAVILGAPGVLAFRRWHSPESAAQTVDTRASLKSRIASAWHFLKQPDVDPARQAQIQDAARHAEKLNVSQVLCNRTPRIVYATPLVALAFVLSFMVPPKVMIEDVDAAVQSRKAHQMEELQALAQELTPIAEEEEEIGAILEKLREIQERFETGAMPERDVMIELSRLDENLQRRLNQLGVENMSGEVNTIMPQLAASSAAKAVASALKENKLDKAAQEMEKVAKNAEKGDLSEEDKKQLATNMGVAASKLGSKSQGSFGGDFAKGAESLKSGDTEGFKSASKSIGNKFRSVKQFRALKKSRGLLSMCKTSLGLHAKECASCSGKGCGSCNGTGLSQSKGLGNGGGKGGLKAGTAATGSPFGDSSRLADSYREMVRVTGMAGEGPVQSEVEVTEGQTSQSQVEVKDLYSEYAAVAEQAIEREEIPLSRRFHVKRYFQAIRPQE